MSGARASTCLVLSGLVLLGIDRAEGGAARPSPPPAQEPRPGPSPRGPASKAAPGNNARAARPPGSAAAVPTSAPSPSASPSLPPLDTGPVEDWYRASSARMVVDPQASAEDIAFTVNLLDWAGKGDEGAWTRMSPVVERAYAQPALKVHLALVQPQADLARAYHEAAAPLSARPAGERDAAAEERLYRKAFLLNPADPDLSNHLAIDASLRKDFKTAERWAKLAIAIDPTFISAYQELAYAYKNQERYREAIAAADRGLDVDGDLHIKAMLLARKGQSHWMLSEEAAAIDAFRTSRRLGGPDWVDSYLSGKQELGKPYREGGEAK